MKIPKTMVILIIILLAGAFLRLFRLDQIPLYGDELTMVYDSYSILKTGHDQLGDFLPLTFKMGAGRPGGYIYAQLPFVAAFGPSVLGERSLSILSGLGLVLLMFYLGRKLFNEKIGIIAAGLFAISLWDINLSRGGFEAHFALFLATLGVLSFLAAKTRPWLLLVSATVWAVAIHTYPTYKMTLPLMIILLVWYQGGFKKLFQRKILPYTGALIVILAVAASSAIFQTLTASSEARFSTLNVFNQDQLKQTLIQQINYERSISNLPETLKPIFHNKIFEYSFVIGEGYLRNFSLDFLFLHGDRNPRHNMSTMGEFYLIEAALIILGLIYLSKRAHREFIFLILWAILAPIPTSLLLETHALRSAFLLPPLILLSALGLFYLWKLSKNKFLYWPLSLVILAYLIQFIFFIEKLYFLAPQEFSRFWSYPAKLASEIAAKEKNNFNFIIISDRIDNIEYAYPVYVKVEPKIVIGQNLQKTKISNYQFKKLDNIYIGFIPDGRAEELIKSLSGSVLFIGSVEESKYLKDYQVLDGPDRLGAVVLR